MCIFRHITNIKDSPYLIRMLTEGISNPLPVSGCDKLPEDLIPQIKLTEQQILKGLPKPGGFGLKDFRFCNY